MEPKFLTFDPEHASKPSAAQTFLITEGEYMSEGKREQFRDDAPIPL